MSKRFKVHVTSKLLLFMVNTSRQDKFKVKHQFFPLVAGSIEQSSFSPGAFGGVNLSGHVAMS